MSAIQIVDSYHARQHLGERSANLFAHVERGRERWTRGLLHQLEQGKNAARGEAIGAFPVGGLTMQMGEPLFPRIEAGEDS